MAEYAFFLQKADWWRKDMALLWGDLSICPMLYCFQLPCHSQAELLSLNGLKVCRGTKTLPQHRFLAGMGRGGHGGHKLWSINNMGKPQSSQGSFYGGSSWETDCLHLQWGWLAVHPSAAAWGHLPHATPKEGHLDLLPQREAEVTPCGWISQLEVHQLLVTGPQVIFPIGLNGHDEPIITSLSEPLASSISLTAGEPIYLGIDILPSPVEEWDRKIPPLGKVPTIVVASPHKSPQNWKAAWLQRSGTSYPK